MGPNKFPTLIEMFRSKRSSSMVFALCMLGLIWIFHFLSADRKETLLQPAKSALNTVVPAPVPSTIVAGEEQGFADLSHLEKYKLSTSFTYARRVIQSKPFSGARPDLTNLNETKLFDEPQVLSAAPEDLQKAAIISSMPILTLNVPSSPKVDTSIMSFGIATNADRIADALPQLQHWLPHTESTLRILVPPSDKISSAQQQMRDLGIKATVKSTQAQFAHAYFSLIKELYDNRTPQTKWLALVDDDTFFPSLPALITHLNKAYDSSEEVLLAAMSDNFEQIRIFGLLPFGGGGIFMSLPLAARLTQPDVWKACMELPNDQGDQIVDQCLKKHSQTRTTFDPYLHQMDFRGDENVAAGYYESGRQMLSVHHWRSWYPLDMPSVAYVSKACGDEGILMRWLFEDDMVLSNGYSIVQYPKGINTDTLYEIEQTWPGDTEHKMGPLRPALDAEHKLTYRMRDTEILEGKGVRQVYTNRAERTTAKDGKVTVKGQDRVLELLWLI